MSGLANFLFGNIFLIILVGIVFFTFRQYKDLKERTAAINDIFDKTLTSYLTTKINEAKEKADKMMKEHGEDEIVAAEINRLLYQIGIFENGTINDKVSASNSINKFKVSKKIDAEKYPYLKELDDLGTFTEEDMTSLENGVAIARKEYNTQAFKYNEKAQEMPIQYLTKFLKLNSQYTIFDAPKYEQYEDNYEVFEEKEPEINSLNVLNRSTEIEEESEVLKMSNDAIANSDEVTIEHSDIILKPSKKIRQDILATDIVDEAELNKDKEENEEDKDNKKNNKYSKYKNDDDRDENKEKKN